MVNWSDEEFEKLEREYIDIAIARLAGDDPLFSDFDVFETNAAVSPEKLQEKIN